MYKIIIIKYDGTTLTADTDTHAEAVERITRYAHDDFCSMGHKFCKVFIFHSETHTIADWTYSANKHVVEGKQ